MSGQRLDVALYLINDGCGSDTDKGKVFIDACRSGKLKVAKKLVEQHKVDPKGDDMLIFCSRL